MISIKFNKGLPSDYESFLIERYDSFITTCRYVEVYYPTYDINHMLVYQDGRLIELLLLGSKGGTTACFNALVELAPDIMEKCLEKIFELFPKVNKIKIDASYVQYEMNKSILYYKSDDYILGLPSSLDVYSAELGSKTRKHIKARQAKLSDQFTTVTFVTKFGVDIEESIIDKIIQLNSDRMKHKGKVQGIDSDYKNNIYRYSQCYGCVVYLELDGKLVAGCIASIIDKGLFLHVIAHDNNYSIYNVGEVCVYNLIQTSIDRGLKKFHFLWGFSELKRRFQAKQSLLFSYMVFRNYSFGYLNCKIEVLFFEFINRFKDAGVFKPIKTSLSTLRQRMKM